MNESFSTPAAHRALLCVMGLAFALTALVSMQRRFEQPELVVSSGREGVRAARDEASPAGMEAVGMLMQKVQKNPGDVDSLLRLGELFIEGRNFQAAEAFMRRAVVAAPSDARAAQLLGVALQMQDKNDEAASWYERAISLRDDPVLRYNIALFYVAHVENGKARAGEHLRAALRLPELPEALAAQIREALAALPSEKNAPAGKKDAVRKSDK